MSWAFYAKAKPGSRRNSKKHETSNINTNSKTTNEEKVKIKSIDDLLRFLLEEKSLDGALYKLCDNPNTQCEYIRYKLGTKDAIVWHRTVGTVGYVRIKYDNVDILAYGFVRGLQQEIIEIAVRVQYQDTVAYVLGKSFERAKELYVPKGYDIKTARRIVDKIEDDFNPILEEIFKEKPNKKYTRIIFE